MASGTISLRPLYNLLSAAPEPEQLLRLSGKLAPGKAYTRECDILTAGISESQGFYLWGCYQGSGLWKNIYLGKAGLGKGANLRKRIREELKDERCFAWRPAFNRQKILSLGRALHGEMWQKYGKGWERALKKETTTHIVWVSVPSIPNEDVLRIEADLIESLNPAANIKRPAPPANLQRDTRQVFELFRKNIHLRRETKYRLKMAEQ